MNECVILKRTINDKGKTNKNGKPDYYIYYVNTILSRQELSQLLENDLCYYFVICCYIHSAENMLIMEIKNLNLRTYRFFKIIGNEILS